MERHAWDSPNTGRGMEIVQFGHDGPPLVYVPGSGGDQNEFAGYGMPEDCATWLDSGRVRIFSIDGLAREHFWNVGLPPRERIRGYARFERYLVDELVPWVRDLTGTERVGIVGVSYGAFAAANALFKHPERVSVACGLGGVYGMWHRLDGYHDDDVYFHTPLEYLPRLEDPETLNQIRETRGLVMFAAERDEWLSSTQRLDRVMRAKGLPHETEIWPAPADHHQRWWKRQLHSFLERHY